MRRHDLVRVAPPDWEVMLAQHPSFHDLPLVPDWALKGWPIIIRRSIPGDPDGAIPVALPLPPSFGKRRVGFSLDRAAYIEAVPPVTLAQAAGVAPAAWQPAIAALLALGRNIGIAPRVFGALLWETVTGLAYVTASSDLDLLWRTGNGADAARLLDGLRHIDSIFPLRLDGELELPGGAGVNWRELAAGGSQGRVLVKSMESVTTRSVAGLFEPASCSL